MQKHTTPDSLHLLVLKGVVWILAILMGVLLLAGVLHMG